LLHDIDIIKSEGPHIGLTLNDCKCELISDDEDVINYVRQLIPAVSTVNSSEAVVLSADGRVIDSVLPHKPTDVQRLTDRLKFLSTHDGFCLLKNCLILPRLMYTLRSAPDDCTSFRPI
jgi:hypothetical protein